MVLRQLRFGGPTFAEMGLPDVIRQLSEEVRGLILVTGPAGPGTTTNSTSGGWMTAVNTAACRTARRSSRW